MYTPLSAVIRITQDSTDGYSSSVKGCEITDAVRAIAEKVEKRELKAAEVTDQTIARHLYLPDVPDPDYMIRTSGEMRISNFLLWQLSYAELYVTDVFWPDFREPQFLAAIEEYGRRHRRFGNIA